MIIKFLQQAYTNFRCNCFDVFSSNVKRTIFLWWNLLNRFFIKENWWRYNVFWLTSKNNLRLFRWVRIETHFPLESPFLYLVEISKSCLAVAFGSFIITKKEFPSAKSFGFNWDFQLDRLCRSKIKQVRESNFVELLHYWNPMMNIGRLARPAAFYYLGNLTIIVINRHKHHYNVIYNWFPCAILCRML